MAFPYCRNGQSDYSGEDRFGFAPNSLLSIRHDTFTQLQVAMLHLKISFVKRNTFVNRSDRTPISLICAPFYHGITDRQVPGNIF